MNFQKLDFLQSIHGTVHDAFSYTIPMLYGKVFEKHDTRFSVQNPSRTPIHFLQEFVRFHFQDLGRQCIILAGILEDLGR